jgi:hypothetical protein
MLSYPEHQLIRESRRDLGARCLRCNSPLLANFALKGEGFARLASKATRSSGRRRVTGANGPSCEWARWLLSSRSSADWSGSS